MSLPPKEKLRRFIVGLLAYDQNLVVIGRENFQRPDFKAGYIAVDDIAKADRVASCTDFDGAAETMTFSDLDQSPLTVSFYGDGARDRAQQFKLLKRSQASSNLQDSLGLVVLNVGGLTDVKALTGSQFSEEIEVDVNVQTVEKATTTTLRFDTAPYEIDTEADAITGVTG